jgi:hypothetical protein
MGFGAFRIADDDDAGGYLVMDDQRRGVRVNSDRE